MLEAFDISRVFATDPVFRIEHLALYPGECTHLTGANGSGKTTLMKLLAGLDRPDTGQIHLKEPGHHRFCRLLRRYFAHLELRGRVLYLHQRPYFFDRSVRANLQLALPSEAGLSAAERQQRVAAALAYSGLEHMSDRSARTLSGGEQQRLAIARAWVRQPRWLLLDEPASNLDQQAVQQLGALIARLKDAGCGILLSSHQDNDFTALCSRTLLLKQGRLHETPR